MSPCLEFGSKQGGFTLIELLIAVSIFALIVTTIYSTFNIGIKAWRRSTEYSILSKNAQLSLERIGRQLRNALNFSGLQLIGETALISIPGLISTPNPLAFQIGKITYFFDDVDNSLQMRKQTYAEAINAIVTRPRALASSVIDLSLRYCRYDEKTDKYIWEENYNQSDGLPLEVKITLILKHPSSEEKLTFTKTVLMPTGE